MRGSVLPKGPWDAKLRTIKVGKSDFIGCGYYGEVYRISPRRVVKVFYGRGDGWKNYCVDDAYKELVKEFKGSRLSKYALPILEVVYVRGEPFRSVSYLGSCEAIPSTSLQLF